MKLKTILLTVLITLIVVSGVFAETTYFTCNSKPADFNGKTFDDLHVFIEGCDNFDSAIIPGKESFVTLKDIRVNGMLFFADDHYDPATEVYTDAEKSDTAKHNDTYLNIIGDSYIEVAHTQCVYDHDCNFGLQYPARIEKLDARLMNNKANGKTVIRGKIDPFIGESSLSGFNIDTFDLDIVKAASEDVALFSAASYMSVEYGKDIVYPYNLRNFLKNNIFDKNITDVFKRGYIRSLAIGDIADFQRGEVEIDLANISVGILYQWEKDSTKNWVPTIVSRGYTTIGVYATKTSFNTSAYAPAAYDYTSDDPNKMVLPMYIDLMILGGSGQNIRYDMDYTRITMMNYVGNEDPNSRLDLNLGNAGNAINMPSIGIANIIGGKFDMSCKQSIKDKPSIEKLNFYEGLQDYQFEEETASTLNKLYFDRTDVEMFNKRTNDQGTGLTEDETTAALREKRKNLYDGKILLSMENYARTTEGYFTLAATLDGMIKPGNTDMSGKSVVSFYGQNLSLGDIAVSKNLGEITNWMDGSCHFWQHGDSKMVVGTIQ